MGLPDKEESQVSHTSAESARFLAQTIALIPFFLGLQKTRRLDHTFELPRTNDHPGDYRSSGCSACHVI